MEELADVVRNLDNHKKQRKPGGNWIFPFVLKCILSGCPEKEFCYRVYK